MNSKDHRYRHFPTAADDAQSSFLSPATPQTESPSYRLAFIDTDFMMHDDLRPVRLQLELLKPELIQRDLGIEKTVVVFGGTRIVEAADAAKAPGNVAAQQRLAVAKSVAAKSRYYDEARKLGMLISKNGKGANGSTPVVITGGEPRRA